MRLEQLTGLRFVAAALVFLSHIKVDAFQPTLEGILGQGFVGVSFFFVLSGFIMSHSYKERLSTGSISRGRYYLLRLARIYPLHLLTTIPFVVAALFSGSLDLLKALACLFLVQSWIPSSGVYFYLNGPSWSLCNEMFFYAAFIVIAKFPWPKMRATLLALGFFVAASTFVLGGLIGDEFWFGGRSFLHWLVYIFPGFRLLEFIVGMCVYDLWRAGKLPAMGSPICGLICLGFAMLLGPRVPEYLRLSLYYIPFVTYLLISFIVPRSAEVAILSFFASRPMVALGNASFAFYLLHQPVINLTFWAFQKLGLSGAYGAIASLLIACGLSFIVFSMYERPVEQLLRGLIMSHKLHRQVSRPTV